MADIKYVLKELSNSDGLVAKELEKNNIHPMIAKLFALRGIKNFSDISELEGLESWINMKDIDIAAETLANSILNKEKIVVVADYDCDGATACAIAIRGVRMLGGNIEFFVPNRFKHGYGLSEGVAKETIDLENPNLIITVDNGVSSIEGVDYANAKGVKVIVTDHHLAGEQLPNAVCIVDPNQPNCNFKSKSIAGCGVIFYVLMATREKMMQLGVFDKSNAPKIQSLLDLVAFGTVADVVKLDKNNRILVRFGLNLIRQRKTKCGILALADITKKKVECLTTQDIGFSLAPRINAAGRLEDMSLGIKCLLSDNYEEAYQYALKLNDINKARKELEGKMKDEISDLEEVLHQENVKVAYSSNFHEGVIGIVASKIKDQYYVPTIIFADAQEEGFLKGSGRSIPEIHLRDAIDYVYKKDKSIIVKFGGHAAAAGLTIKKEKLNDFTKLFEESVLFFSEGRKFTNTKEIDFILEANEMSIPFIKEINKEVWGQGFTQPLFAGGFNIVEERLLKDTHLKLLLELDGYYFEAIWFFKDKLINKKQTNFVYSLQINDFLNQENVQLLIENEVPYDE